MMCNGKFNFHFDGVCSIHSLPTGLLMKTLWWLFVKDIMKCHIFEGLLVHILCECFVLILMAIAYLCVCAKECMCNESFYVNRHVVYHIHM